MVLSLPSNRIILLLATSVIRLGGVVW